MPFLLVFTLIFFLLWFLVVQNTVITGGFYNTADGWGSFVGGGDFNSVQAGEAVISGGSSNVIVGSNNYFNFIGGGYQNTVVGSSLYGSTIAGGLSNVIESYGCFIGGGEANTASGSQKYVALSRGGPSEIVCPLQHAFNNSCSTDSHPCRCGVGMQVSLEGRKMSLLLMPRPLAAVSATSLTRRRQPSGEVSTIQRWRRTPRLPVAPGTLSEEKVAWPLAPTLS